MPQLIEHIDAIARRKQRDVLYLSFFDAGGDWRVPGNWQQNATREQVIAWLATNGYGWEPCGEIAKEAAMASYGGSIYVDTAFDQADPSYQALAAFLEHPDGTPRLPGMKFWAVSLDAAMQNAHHDAPGFWDQWAEKF
ncbi:hypothetical protein [Cupriavidus oxalaticus]|uniref:Uncharacterized protein n=1 Tax=Cupriavidus oxalaticus TaxID=96344 RepID=A0A5P3VRG7_9BURK|nr:hypothetical protein [Cupriavidus oxalaticus]QEZ47992.1 hypothetical protein D2917_28370 [Cupriavidus oxalaticus]